MGNDRDSTGHADARAMIDTFASVGATRFDVTWTNRAGDKEFFRRSMSLADLRRTLPAMLDAAPALGQQMSRRVDRVEVFEAEALAGTHPIAVEDTAHLLA
jgi:hypothetical protein